MINLDDHNHHEIKETAAAVQADHLENEENAVGEGDDDQRMEEPNANFDDGHPFEGGSGHISSNNTLRIPTSPSSSAIPLPNPVTALDDLDDSPTETACNDLQNVIGTIWGGRNKLLVDSDDESSQSDDDDQYVMGREADALNANSLIENEDMFIDEHDNHDLSVRGEHGSASETTATRFPAYGSRHPDGDGLVRITEYDQLNEDFMMSHVNRAAKLTESQLFDIRAFNYKVSTMLKDIQFLKLPRAFSEFPPMESLYRLRKEMETLSGLKSRPIDCCFNSCALFYGFYADLQHCPYCQMSRYDGQNRARKQFHYLPLTSRLVNMFLNKELSDILRYRSRYKIQENAWSDFFDGKGYKRLLNLKVKIGNETLPYYHFVLDTDIALGISFDGFCPFKHRKHSCWPIILFNYNLPPETRCHVDNVIPLGCIPGPRSMKDSDSFLMPFIEEMLQLSRGVKAFDALTEKYFVLHAFLVNGCGDIPAVAKLMRMKGVNALLPCRFCDIPGQRIPDSRNNSHYVSCCGLGITPTDPRNLPMRSTSDFMRQANEVSCARNDTEAEQLAKSYGIKGVPALSVLESLRFPHSFPIEFMHIVFSNLLPQLSALWSVKPYKGLDAGIEDYSLDKSVWSAISEAIKASGDLMPATFGPRLPDVVDERYQYTAEMWSMWGMLVAPIVLRERLQDRYYDHFVRLVRLLNICLQTTITRDDLNELKAGFPQWVLEFEEIYYQDDPQRLAVCTLPVHYLLHIPDSIENCGPVWVYWAFAMERYCGSLQPAINSRKHPYRCLDRRILELAQLNQMRLVYGLKETLDLSNHRSIEESGTSIAGYDNVVLTSSRQPLVFSRRQHQKVAQHLANRLAGERDDYMEYVPESIMCYGKMKWRGGDMAHARELVNDTGRDMSYVKYFSLKDRNARRHNQPIEFETKIKHGQIRRFFVVEAPAPEEPDNPIPYLLALVLPCKTTLREDEGCLPHFYMKSSLDFEPEDVIDVSSIKGLAARIADIERGEHVFVEKPGSYEWMAPDRDLEMTALSVG